MPSAPLRRDVEPRLITGIHTGARLDPLLAEPEDVAIRIADGKLLHPVGLNDRSVYDHRVLRRQLAVQRLDVCDPEEDIPRAALTFVGDDAGRILDAAKHQRRAAAAVDREFRRAA